MTTKEFNNKRSAEWADRFTKDESRIFLAIGAKQDGTHTFIYDASQTPEKIATKLEELAQELRTHNAKMNN